MSPPRPAAHLVDPGEPPHPEPPTSPRDVLWTLGTWALLGVLLLQGGVRLMPEAGPPGERAATRDEAPETREAGHSGGGEQAATVDLLLENGLPVSAPRPRPKPSPSPFARVRTLLFGSVPLDVYHLCNRLAGNCEGGLLEELGREIAASSAEAGVLLTGDSDALPAEDDAWRRFRSEARLEDGGPHLNAAGSLPALYFRAPPGHDLRPVSWSCTEAPERHRLRLSVTPEEGAAAGDPRAR